ncbi:MAG: hypothetical protein M3O46_05065 [Myxococcota bacterium]|jgi:hypothetical protein|nr:hypothetical protein [Myxococcota bacterium]
MGTSREDLVNAINALIDMAEKWARSKKPIVQTADEMNLIAAIARYQRIRDERKKRPSQKPRQFDPDEQPTFPRKRKQ